MKQKTAILLAILLISGAALSGARTAFASVLVDQATGLTSTNSTSQLSVTSNKGIRFYVGPTDVQLAEWEMAFPSNGNNGLGPIQIMDMSNNSVGSCTPYFAGNTGDFSIERCDYSSLPTLKATTEYQLVMTCDSLTPCDYYKKTTNPTWPIIDSSLRYDGNVTGSRTTLDGLTKLVIIPGDEVTVTPSTEFWSYFNYQEKVFIIAMGMLAVPLFILAFKRIL